MSTDSSLPDCLSLEGLLFFIVSFNFVLNVCLFFRALPVFLYLLFLVAVVMIMRTILIAHMAATFGALNRDAVHQLELSRAWILPGLESGLIWDWVRPGHLDVHVSP